MHKHSASAQRRVHRPQQPLAYLALQLITSFIIIGPGAASVSSVVLTMQKLGYGCAGSRCCLTATKHYCPGRPYSVGRTIQKVKKGLQKQTSLRLLVCGPKRGCLAVTAAINQNAIASASRRHPFPLSGSLCMAAQLPCGGHVIVNAAR